MDNIQDLIAEKTRIEKEHKKIQAQLQKLRDKAHNELRKQITKMCAEAGTTVEELFGGKAKTAAKKTVKKKRTAKSSTPDKYFIDGKGVDGRKARSIDGFDKVRVDGKIDDKKALDAKMINPAWLKSNSAVSNKFVKDFKVDVAKYAGK